LDKAEKENIFHISINYIFVFIVIYMKVWFIPIQILVFVKQFIICKTPRHAE